MEGYMVGSRPTTTLCILITHIDITGHHIYKLDLPTYIIPELCRYSEEAAHLGSFKYIERLKQVFYFTIKILYSTQLTSRHPQSDI